ncbi:amidase [Halieaceae bacterium IMCC14734]|uniref:Amidase n=1 Tax=Candidatus Litorirhabdus singularis TaxID=2518993 RepID=A0ABT3TEA2_9GAMM|nr:amidase family protein [Candidatus Litorirhabdus singularis]MCX2980116.1 amidase [Candidatus Litorirhabdus singularis]
MTGFSQYDEFDGLGLAQLVREGQVSALELLEEAISRTERVNGQLNAVTYKCYDLARTEISQGLSPGAFAGVPFLLKDLHLHMTGTPTTNGSAMWRGTVADHDSTLVQRYRSAGLVCFGKTNSPELGLMPVTEPVEYGPSRNPWNTDHTPGGSSGGAGAAVAAGIVPMAHASDGGGSIRIPASCCGLVGLKPSRGRIPFGPDKAEGWGGQSSSHIVSRSVRDTAAMLDATAGSEIGEAYAAPAAPDSFLEAALHSPAPLRIAVSMEKWAIGDYGDEALAGLQQTVTLLEGLGHRVEEARPDYDGEAVAASQFKIISANTALAVRQRAAELGCSLEQLAMEDGTRFTAEMGLAVSGADYVGAVQMNQNAGRILGRFHQQYDVVLAPTLSRPPVPVGYISQAPAAEYADRLFRFMGDAGLYNQTGQPSISLPLHWSNAGLPMGMMFSAAYGNDALLLQLAIQLEQAQPWAQQRPPLHAGAMVAGAGVADL